MRGDVPEGSVRYDSDSGLDGVIAFGGLLRELEAVRVVICKVAWFKGLGLVCQLGKWTKPRPKA